MLHRIDGAGQKLAYVYFEDEHRCSSSKASSITEEEEERALDRVRKEVKRQQRTEYEALEEAIPALAFTLGFAEFALDFVWAEWS